MGGVRLIQVVVEVTVEMVAVVIRNRGQRRHLPLLPNLVVVAFQEAR